MKAKRINKYRKWSDKANNYITMYVYKVISASPAELEDYETTQAENYVADEDGTPLYFSPQFEGNLIDLEKSKAKDDKGNLRDVYKAVSSEDFELKRSVYDKPVVTASSMPALKPLVRQQTGSVLTANSTESVNTDAVDTEAVADAEGFVETPDFE